MNDPSIKIGVAAGMIALPALFIATIELLLGHCLFEGGCGSYAYENLFILGIFVIACFAAPASGWSVTLLARTMPMKYIYLSMIGMGVSILGAAIFEGRATGTFFGGLFILSMLALWIFSIGWFIRKLLK